MAEGRIAAAPGAAEDGVEALRRAAAAHGLLLRGGFRIEAADLGPPLDLPEGGTVLLLGNAGAAMWRAFAASGPDGPDPLNRWTMSVVAPIAAALGARPLYPFGDTAVPFQRWAARAERLQPSPLGLLMHPDYGLWHAYRAALVFAAALPLPEAAARPHPCASCAGRPCLSACPVGAFSEGGYDVAACAAWLASGTGADCLAQGCRARDACPVGRAWRYPDAQVRFHMQAYRRAVGAA